MSVIRHAMPKTIQSRLDRSAVEPDVAAVWLHDAVDHTPSRAT